MPLLKDDSITVSGPLYNELSSNLGRNFELYRETTNLKSTKKTGMHSKQHNSGVHNESSTSSKRAPLQASFPPLLSTFTLRQTKQAVAPHTRPIVMTAELRSNLNQVLGESNVRLLEKNIGFQERNNSGTDESAGASQLPNVFNNVFGDQEKPNYRFAKKPHFTKINQQFFWPNMTNPLCEIPVEIKTPSHVHDLKTWISHYGMPCYEKLPTGAMTTFRSNHRRFGKEKSRGMELVQTATGVEWKKAFDEKCSEVALQQTKH